MGDLVVARALGRVVVTVHGPLDAEQRQTLERLLLEEQVAELIVDLRLVVSVDGHAMRMLADASRTVDERGGRLSVGCHQDLEADLAMHGVPLTPTHRRRAPR